MPCSLPSSQRDSLLKQNEKASRRVDAAEVEAVQALVRVLEARDVITSYSIHYTKLYEMMPTLFPS